MVQQEQRPPAPSPEPAAPVAATPGPKPDYEDYERTIKEKDRPPRPPRSAAMKHNRLVIVGVIVLMIVMILAVVVAMNPNMAAKLIESNGLRDGKYMTYQVTYCDNGQIETGTTKITFNNVTSDSLTQDMEITMNGRTVHEQVTLTRSGDTWTDSVTGETEIEPSVLGEDKIDTIYGQKTVNIREYNETAIEWDDQDTGLTYKALMIYSTQNWMVLELQDTNIGELK